jgi:hypothetical protein
MKTYGDWCHSSNILGLGTRWRSLVSFTPRPLSPSEIAAGTHWTGGWVGPRTGLDNVEKRKIEPGQSSPSLYRLSNSNSYLITTSQCLFTFFSVKRALLQINAIKRRHSFHAPAVLLLRKELLVPVGYEAGLAPEPAWKLWRRKKSHFPHRKSNIASLVVQRVAQSLNQPSYTGSVV